MIETQRISIFDPTDEERDVVMELAQAGAIASIEANRPFEEIEGSRYALSEFKQYWLGPWTWTLEFTEPGEGGLA